MTDTASQKLAPGQTPTKATLGRRHWIDDWNPDDDTFWHAVGHKVARRNLIGSIFADHVAFNVWVIWTVVVVDLANVGIKLSLSDQFVLTALPNLIGSALRIPYTFAVPRFGGRAWTVASSVVLLVPTTLLAVVVPSGWLAHQGHSTQFWVLAAAAATAGVGGANFSSSMTNISFFYPEKRKGYALGLNAAGGNLGVAVAQLVVPLVVIVGVPAGALKLADHQVHLAYAGLFYMPFVVVSALYAWARMDSLSEARTDKAAYAAALSNPHTWVMAALYIGTFGSFIGYSFALPLVIKNTFPTFLAHHPFISTYLAGLSFLGATVGSLTRPLGGALSDRLGGSKVTVAVFGGMALFGLAAIYAVAHRSFAGFLTAFIAIFALSGIGNGRRTA